MNFSREAVAFSRLRHAFALRGICLELLIQNRQFVVGMFQPMIEQANFRILIGAADDEQQHIGDKQNHDKRIEQSQRTLHDLLDIRRIICHIICDRRHTQCRLHDV